MPQLGIFWVYRGQVLGRARPLAEGCERWPGLLDSPDDHIALWEEPTLRKAHPSLARFDYTEVPRGRVIFSIKECRAIIYLDEVLSGPAVRECIQAFFNLSATPVSWEQDPHYTTDPEKLVALFEEDFPSSVTMTLKFLTLNSYGAGLIEGIYRLPHSHPTEVDS